MSNFWGAVHLAIRFQTALAFGKFIVKSSNDHTSKHIESKHETRRYFAGLLCRSLFARMLGFGIESNIP